MARKLISFVSPCYNEEENVEELYERVAAVMALESAEYDFEYIFIDNASTDSTLPKLRRIAAVDKRVKVIVNTRNFGHIRSPYWGMLQSSGEATIYLASDLQDPPELARRFIRVWEEGCEVVLAVKPIAEGNPLLHLARKLYYRALDRIADVPMTRDATGFGLYAKTVLDKVREINDPYPYFRGLIDELGFRKSLIPFEQPRRLRGITKNNFYALYDIAMLGIVSHSMVPLRLASLFGFVVGAGSILMAFLFFVAKLIWWDWFSVGIAPLIIGMFFMFGVLLIFIGILGEYVGAIHTYSKKRPVIVERERINFD